MTTKQIRQAKAIELVRCPECNARAGYACRSLGIYEQPVSPHVGRMRALREAESHTALQQLLFSLLRLELSV